MQLNMQRMFSLKNKLLLCFFLMIVNIGEQEKKITCACDESHV